MATLADPVTGVMAGVGEVARSPLHVVDTPGLGNWYRLSVISNTIAAALAANSELFQFRFVAGTKTKALLYIAKISAAIVSVGTAIGPIGFELVPARNWTVAGSGGTRIANTSDNMQTETALPNSQVLDIGIATTGALTVGTKVLDANGQGNILSGILTGAATTQQVAELVTDRYLFNAMDAGGQPLVLANNEGFIIKTTHIGPAALTYVIGVTIAWREVVSF